jgi:hypothetical protein
MEDDALLEGPSIARAVDFAFSCVSFKKKERARNLLDHVRCCFPFVFNIVFGVEKTDTNDIGKSRNNTKSSVRSLRRLKKTKNFGKAEADDPLDACCTLLLYPYTFLLVFPPVSLVHCLLNSYHGLRSDCPRSCSSSGRPVPFHIVSTSKKTVGRKVKRCHSDTALVLQYSASLLVKVTPTRSAIKSQTPFS